MIVEWLMKVAAGFVQFLTSLFPDWIAPDWLLHVDQSVNGLTEPIQPFGALVDFTLAGTIATAAVATWVVCFTIKLVLRIVSHVPEVGGSG